MLPPEQTPFLPKTPLLIPGSIAALFASTSISAQIVTNTGLGISGDSVGNGDTQFLWNIDNSGNDEIKVYSNIPYLDLTNAMNGFGIRATGTSSEANILNLALGAAVNSGSFAGYVVSVLSAGSFKNAQGFVSGATGYIGFQFNPSGSLNLYGWAEVILTEGGSTGTFEIKQWAYESSGAGITVGAGAVPEPAAAATGLGLLALGAAGLRRSRWLKRSKQTD